MIHYIQVSRKEALQQESLIALVGDDGVESRTVRLSAYQLGQTDSRALMGFDKITKTMFWFGDVAVAKLALLEQAPPLLAAELAEQMAEEIGRAANTNAEPDSACEDES